MNILTSMVSEWSEWWDLQVWLRVKFVPKTRRMGQRPQNFFNLTLISAHDDVVYFRREDYVSANRTFIDTRKRTKLCSECAHCKGYESANRHLL